jgi:aminomethyltransferase
MEVYTARTGTVAEVDVLVSRTGYTGEDGFELYVDASRAGTLWDRLLEAGGPRGLVPIGLAARDTLRFEMGYCLYGNDIDETTSPLEAGLGWTVRLDKEAFTGRDALRHQKETGLERKLVGLTPEQPRAVPRKGYPLRDGDAVVGSVTSGTFAPSLGRGLAMGYVDRARAARGHPVSIDIRGRIEPATVTRLPFYTRGSRKAAAPKTA